MEAYLRNRMCWIESAALRFLPERGAYHPAMIARFGTGDVTGIHLTRLSTDGGKAGSEKDKIMIGPSMGQPIIVRDNPDRGELMVTEGIEDAASLAIVTGWSAWAAGSAGRIAAALSDATSFDKVFIAVDHDQAGMRALERARAVRKDVVPIDCAKLLGLRERMDPNRVLMKFGPNVLLGAIEWAEAQDDYARGRIGFHAMQQRLDGIGAIRSAAGSYL